MDLVTFEIGGEPYALEVAAVREVLRSPDLQPADDGRSFLAGWADLAAGRVPVVDLRSRFGMSDPAEGPVLVVHGSDGQELGLRVDLVREVGPGPPRPVEPIPSYFAGSGGLLRGLVPGDAERLTVLLDPAELLSAAERADLAGADDREVG